MNVFDIEKAKEGAAVCTRNGKKARIICFDRDYCNDLQIIALVKEDDSRNELVKIYNKHGVYTGPEGDSYDLMMAPVKKKVWINFYKTEYNNILSDQITWDSKKEAEQNKGVKALGWIGAYEIEVEI